MRTKGKRALVRPLASHRHRVDDKVLAETDNKTLKSGRIISIVEDRKSAFVELDDGTKRLIEFSRLLQHPADEEIDEDDDKGLGGFNQYSIKWKNENTHFNFMVDTVEFYGWWRKMHDGRSREIAWAIDLFAKRGENAVDVCSIPYLAGDPRKNMRSLNADLCTAANGFLYNKCKGSFGTIDELYRRAKLPQLKIGRIEVLDRIILQLKDFRDTALRLGGRRHFRLQAEYDDDPSLGIQVDFSSQAFKLKGKTPSLRNGAIYDRQDDVRVKDPEKRGKVLELRPDAGNVTALVARLKDADKSEARKIRATLRRMGHTGGARALIDAASKEE